MIRWEYVIVALPEFRPSTSVPGASAAVEALNREGRMGWEAVGMRSKRTFTLSQRSRAPCRRGRPGRG